MSTAEVLDKVAAAASCGDWRELIKWDDRIDDLVEALPNDSGRDAMLSIFKEAHKSAMNSAGSSAYHLLSYARRSAGSSFSAPWSVSGTRASAWSTSPTTSWRMTRGSRKPCGITNELVLSAKVIPKP